MENARRQGDKMKLNQIFTWVPIGLAIIGSLYTGINVIIKLNNTIEQHTLQLVTVSNQLANIDEKVTIEIKNLKTE